jgi:3-methyladenine DNA glycosylase/8-oxoguanine DNA glycosylase
MASFTPRGSSYNPRVHLRRRIVALRGDASERGPLAIAFSWSDGAVRAQIVTKRGGRAVDVGSEDVERAIEIARAMSAVDDDPTEFLAMVRDHAVLGRLARTADPRIAKAPTVFECLTISIIEQLVTGEEARAAIRRLWRQAGDSIAGTHLIAAPTPQAVRRVPMWRMHEMGVGSRRALTLHEAAGRGDAIERLRDDGHLPEIFIEKIQSLHGVGPWTANAVARSALGFADAIPVGDFHAPFVLSGALAGRDDLTLDDRDEADRVMIEALEPFRPHRARVAILFETRDAVANKDGKPWRLPRVDAHRREPWKY